MCVYMHLEIKTFHVTHVEVIVTTCGILFSLMVWVMGTELNPLGMIQCASALLPPPKAPHCSCVIIIGMVNKYLLKVRLKRGLLLSLIHSKIVIHIWCMAQNTWLMEHNLWKLQWIVSVLCMSSVYRTMIYIFDFDLRILWGFPVLWH